MTEDAGAMGAANSDQDHIREAGAVDPGTIEATEVDGDETVEDDRVEDDDVEFIFDVDGDTTGADPDSDDPAVNIRPHEKGHFT